MSVKDRWYENVKDNVVICFKEHNLMRKQLELLTKCENSDDNKVYTCGNCLSCQCVTKLKRIES